MSTDSNTLFGDIQRQKYPGYGVCIYCGSDGGADGLRDEHIIPLALKGNAIIKEASCTICEKKINPADTHLAKHVFWNYRLLTGAPTRNPQDRPNILTATFDIGDNEVSRDLPIQDFPFSTALPIWGNAGFFRSAPIDAPFAKTVLHVYHWMPPNIRETLGIAEDEDLRVRSSIRSNPELFARAIAKIAYCYTVIRFGLNGFRFAYSSYKELGMPIYHVIAGAPKSS
jgi:hypothetical protein